MEKEFEDLLKFLKDAQLLKSVKRHAWNSEGRQESVPEHTWRMALMALVIGKKIEGLDIDKALRMIIIHDLGEVYQGENDHPAFKGQPSDKKQSEEDALNKVLSPVDDEISEEMMSLWHEYNDCKTIEARFVKALDKLEVLIQHNESDISTWDEREFEYNLVHGKEYTGFHDFISDFRKAVDEQTMEKLKEAKR